MSRPGEGATFLIELPILLGADQPAAASQSSHATEHLREGTGKKVLVIDDEESL